MRFQSDTEYARSLSTSLLWTGVVTLLVGIKLVLSFFVPGLKTPGELLLSGALLPVYTVRIFSLRSGLESRATQSSAT